MSTALHLAEDEHLASARVQALTDLSAGIRALERAAAHVRALLQVDIEFIEGRDGCDIAGHVDSAIRGVRAAYAVLHMIADKERP